MVVKNVVASSQNAELKPQDQKRLIRGRRFGIIGVMMTLVGITGFIAVSDQLTWQIDRSLYLALAFSGSISILYGQKVMRPLMKEYSRQFALIS